MPLPFGGAFLPLIGGIVDKIFGDKSADRAEAFQREAAQNGLQWRMEDAKKAGVNPLAALGFSGTSFSPVTVGTDFAGVGQDISRAMDATRTQDQRNSAYAKSVEQLTLEHMGLENQLLKSQILNGGGRATNPAFPVPVMDSALSGQGSLQLSSGEVGGPGPVPVGPATANQPIFMGPLGVIPANPKVSSAQDVENRYGDIVQNVFGTAAVVNDLMQSFLIPWVKSMNESGFIPTDDEVRAMLTGPEAQARASYIRQRLLRN